MVWYMLSLLSPCPMLSPCPTLSSPCPMLSLLTMSHAHPTPCPCSAALTLPHAQARELGAAFARAKELPAEMPLEVVLSGEEPGLFWSYFVNGWCAGAASRTAWTLGPLDPPARLPCPRDDGLR